MKCPGQDMQYWNTEAIFEINCPKCSKPVEFYKDDTNRKCRNCGHRFVNPKMDFGCAAYCQYAEQCLGTLPEEFAGAQENLLKDKVAVEMKRHFKNDFHKIGRATRVARYAEAIGKSESNSNLAAILCAAYLHDVHNPESETDSIKITSVARDILTRLKAKELMTDAVCALLQQLVSPADVISSDQQVLSDALALATLEEICKQDNGSSQESIKKMTSQIVTAEAQSQAKELLTKYEVGSD